MVKKKRKCVNTRLLLCAVACYSLLTACSPNYYSANTQNAPMISEKGETSIAAAGNTSQIEFQGAYGLTNSIAIQANGGWFIPEELDNGNGGSGRFGEGGIGYYKVFNENLVFETYGLIGAGRVENHLPSTVEQYPGTTGKISANILRYGIQPVFGYKSEYFSVAISSRFSVLNYSNIRGNLTFEDEDQIAYLQSNSSNFLIEPALTLRGGIDWLKFQFQVGPSFNLSNNSFRQSTSFATIGLFFNFSSMQE